MSYGSPTRGTHAWTLDEATSRPFIARALEVGINFFDTANIYSDGTSEEITGKALRDMAPRDEIVLATKVHGKWKDKPNAGGLSRKAIMAAVDDSLKRLGMDYIDLYQIHRFDYDTPLEETLEALHDLVKAGKVRYIGASSMYAWQFCKALEISRQHNWSRFVSMQPFYNLAYREEEREMLPLCKEEGIAVIPWSPLGRGRLTRSWQDEPATSRAESDKFGNSLYSRTKDADRAVVERLKAIAKQRGVPMAQIALAWVLKNPVITSPIVGATKAHHLEDAVAALTLSLSEDEIKALEEPYVPHPVLGFS
jgi:aryl-alcohol dehydrogenase-like predicted oxidoreductase